MTMTAVEAMQAILAGKTVMMQSVGGSRVLVKLGKDDMLICRADDEIEFHEPDYTGFNHADGVYEEYTLTFKDALKAMIDGKTVESDVSKRKYHLMNIYGYHETFVEVGDESCTTILTEIKLSEQIGKWKVVE